uniref:glutathione transferase n=1 Tax=Culex pipiens TaxID=7175 RepID=A0A8D8IBG7_CULPI
MAGLVLYTLNVSAPCRAVELCIKALGLHVDRKIVDLLAGEHLKPEFVKLNPQHAVPVLDDNGTIITDSHAIMIYLVTMYGTNGSDLYPMEVVSQAKVHAGLHFNSSVLFPRMRFAFEPVFSSDTLGISEEKRDYVDKAYQLLEDILENSGYVAGKGLSIADFSCVTSISSMMKVIPMERERYPRIYDWLDRLKTLPYYEEANGGPAELHGAMVAKKLQQNLKNAKQS